MGKFYKNYRPMLLSNALIELIIRYNLARLEEHKLPDMLMHVESYLPGVVIFDRKLYLFGGCPGGSAEYISLLRRKKQQLAPMLCAVSDMGVNKSYKKFKNLT